MRSLMPKWFAAMTAASVAVVAYGTWQSFTAQDNLQTEELKPAATQEISAPAKEITLKDYFWIDAVPDNAYTPFNAYVFTDGIGINSQFASSFKVLLEIFEYRHTKDKVSFEFPHDNRSAKSSYTITAYKNPKYPFLTAQLTLAGDPQNGGKEKAYFTGPDLHLESQGYALPAPLQNALIAARAQMNSQKR
ncbi:MAG: hypothetical protein Q4F00_06450 [bacterium]|nr:hypothetical protein [bacterium]